MPPETGANSQRHRACCLGNPVVGPARQPSPGGTGRMGVRTRRSHRLGKSYYEQRVCHRSPDGGRGWAGCGGLRSGVCGRRHDSGDRATRRRVRRGPCPAQGTTPPAHCARAAGFQRRGVDVSGDRAAPARLARRRFTAPPGFPGPGSRLGTGLNPSLPDSWPPRALANPVEARPEPARGRPRPQPQPLAADAAAGRLPAPAARSSARIESGEAKPHPRLAAPRAGT